PRGKGEKRIMFVETQTLALTTDYEGPACRRNGSKTGKFKIPCDHCITFFSIAVKIYLTQRRRDEGFLPKTGKFKSSKSLATIAKPSFCGKKI
ncbi:hypothetical protein M3O96_18175, partial [Aquiflexum sp. TKW24L]|uniref:hypothetical protein n=1 Tax=Aquiflexum sp. TKW24L TaxID=2942212 RepID=UPI0020BFC341